MHLKRESPSGVDVSQIYPCISHLGLKRDFGHLILICVSDNLDIPYGSVLRGLDDEQGGGV